MWVPQGTDANLVMSLDPVIKFSGLPVPNVELPICITGHHIAGGHKGSDTERGEQERMERLALC